MNAGLLAFRTAAQVHKKPRPYIYENFNVNSHYASSSRWVDSALARIINGVIQGLNEDNKRIPKYIIFIIDKDLLESLKYCDFGIHKLLKGTMQWLFNETNKHMEARRED